LGEPVVWFCYDAPMHYLLFALLLAPKATAPLPQGFVYLADVAPTIVQDLRYAQAHNFTGAKVPGYTSGRCILTQPAAEALRQAQQEFLAFGLTLKVYDCYRPQVAVDAFAAWAQKPEATAAQTEFYPTLNKAVLHASGYIAHRSGHSRGSTVDLTLVPLPVTPEPAYRVGELQVSCTAAHGERWPDNSIDMGTGYDCFDVRAHTQNTDIPAQARIHRLLLRATLRRYGMINYPKEWWHYSYYNEPFQKGFAFDVQ
jgi:D-alanyl-D-alanine dipeptidase